MILGDGGLHPGKYNMALIRRAIKGGWGVPEDIKRMVVNQMALVVGRSDNERDKIAAARVLVAADAVDAKMEMAEKFVQRMTPQVVDELSDEELLRIAKGGEG